MVDQTRSQPRQTSGGRQVPLNTASGYGLRMNDERTLFLVEDADARKLTDLARARTRREDIESDLAATSWYEWSRRRWLHSSYMTACSDVLACEEALGGCWDELAGRVIDVEVGHLHSASGSKRNAYHPEVLLQLNMVAAQVAHQLQAARIRTSYSGVDQGVAIADVDELVVRVTPEAVQRRIEYGVESLQLVASDPVFLHEWIWIEGSSGSERVLVVQHKASGLRARFHVDSGDEPGLIYSKPYKIESIDPDAPGVLLAWEAYVGLGIGARLYQAGADLVPGQRWAHGTIQEPARAVRRRLHAREPYRWQSSCTWCQERGVDWHTATAADFTGHPHVTGGAQGAAATGKGNIA